MSNIDCIIDCTSLAAAACHAPAAESSEAFPPIQLKSMTVQHAFRHRTLAAHKIHEPNLSGGVRAIFPRACSIYVMLLVLLAGCVEAAAESPHMILGENALSPVAFTDFCLRKPARCAPSREIRHITLDEHNLQQLDAVNRNVNQSIAPSSRPVDLGTPWQDDTQVGNCVEFALTKRAQLLDLQLPSSALLLGLTIVPSGEAHLVLVVVTDQGDFVLDNLTDTIVRWDKIKYRWVNRSSPRNPQFWQTIVSPPYVLGIN
jgi:predicted transglutaminase-like cysteine proteinase